MAADRLFAEEFAELMRQTFREPPCIHEDQRRAMGIDQFDNALIDFLPLLMHADRAQFAGRGLDPQIELSLMANIDDHGRFMFGNRE